MRAFFGRIGGAFQHLSAAAVLMSVVAVLVVGACIRFGATVAVTESAGWAFGVGLDEVFPFRPLFRQTMADLEGNQICIIPDGPFELDEGRADYLDAACSFAATAICRSPERSASFLSAGTGLAVLGLTPQGERDTPGVGAQRRGER